MSYLSDTFGVPLKNQFTPQDTQVTPESLLAPQQPFGQPNAIGVSQQTTPPFVNAAQPPAMWSQPTQEDQYSYAPNQYAPPASVGGISPSLARLGVSVPQLANQPSAADLSQNDNTPGAIPAPAQLLDLPVRDQAKESKRLTNAAGIGGLIGLLLGGGQGAIQGASSAMQGGGQALDFAAQSAMQKATQENQKRLQDAANERQVWADLSNEEQNKWQRKFQEEGLTLRNKAEVEKEFKARQEEIQKVSTELDRSRKDAWDMAKSLVGEDGKPLPQAKEIISAYNQRVLARAGVLGDSTAAFLLDADKVLPQGTTLKSATDVAKLSNTIASGKKLGLENDFLAQSNDIKTRLLNQKIDLNTAELGYKQILNKYLDKNKALTNQQLEYVVTNLPKYLGLRDSAIEAMIAERQAQTKRVAEGAKNGKVNPVLLSEIQDVRKSMSADGWTKTEAAIRKKYDIRKFNFDPTSDMGKKQAADRAAMEKEIQSTRDAIVEKAKAVGFTDVTFENGQFKYKTLPNPIPNNPDYLASDKPNGFGSYNSDWTGKQLTQFREMAQGKSSIIKVIPNDAVSNLKPLGWRTTLYGYEGDNTKGDSNSPNGIGTQNKPLTPGSIAVSRDVLESLTGRGYKMGDPMPVYFQKQGKTYKGAFILRDVTAKTDSNGKPLVNRVDIFMPAGTKDAMDKYDGASVIAVGRKEVQKLQTEEVKKPAASTTAKKTVAPKPTAKVQSSRPTTLSEVDKKIAELEAKIRSSNSLRD